MPPPFFVDGTERRAFVDRAEHQVVMGGMENRVSIGGAERCVLADGAEDRARRLQAFRPVYVAAPHG